MSKNEKNWKIYKKHSKVSLYFWNGPKKAETAEKYNIRERGEERRRGQRGGEGGREGGSEGRRERGGGERGGGERGGRERRGEVTLNRAVGRGRLDWFLLVAFAHAEKLPSFFEIEIAGEFRRGLCRETQGEVGWWWVGRVEGVEVVRSCASNVVAPAKMSWFHRARWACKTCWSIRGGKMERAHQSGSTNRNKNLQGDARMDEAEDQRRRGNAAHSRIQHGQVSRARHELTGSRLAPKTEETLAELQRTPQEQRRQISPDIPEFRPEVPLSSDKEMFINALRSSPSGSAPGPGGCTNEMLRVCLDDAHVLDLLYLAARGETPASRSFLRATMTALSKKDGGIRGIATGSSFRRLVGKTLARQFGAVVEPVCAPFQLALSTRPGTDCWMHVPQFFQCWGAVPCWGSWWTRCKPTLSRKEILGAGRRRMGTRTLKVRRWTSQNGISDLMNTRSLRMRQLCERQRKQIFCWKRETRSDLEWRIQRCQTQVHHFLRIPSWHYPTEAVWVIQHTSWTDLNSASSTEARLGSRRLARWWSIWIIFFSWLVHARCGTPSIQCRWRGIPPSRTWRQSKMVTIRQTMEKHTMKIVEKSRRNNIRSWSIFLKQNTFCRIRRTTQPIFSRNILTDCVQEHLRRNWDYAFWVWLMVVRRRKTDDDNWQLLTSVCSWAGVQVLSVLTCDRLYTA